MNLDPPPPTIASCGPDPWVILNAAQAAADPGIMSAGSVACVGRLETING